MAKQSRGLQLVRHFSGRSLLIAKQHARCRILVSNSASQHNRTRAVSRVEEAADAAAAAAAVAPAD